MAGEPLERQAFGDGDGLHNVPGRVVGAADVTHLARFHERVQRSHCFFERCLAVPPVQLVQVDVVGTQPREAGLERTHDMVPGTTGSVRPGLAREAALGGQQELLSSPFYDLAHDLFRGAVRVDVGRVYEVDAGLDTAVEDAAGLGDPRRAHAGELPRPPEGHRPERKHRDAQPAPAQLPVFHPVMPSFLVSWPS